MLPILVLQKPSRNSKIKDHTTCLVRWLKAWQNGDLNDLLFEGKTIQLHLPKFPPKYNQDRLARSFANLMFQGKTNAALRLLSDNSRGGLLHLDDTGAGQGTVRDILIDKHPPPQPSHPDSIISDPPPDTHPVLFESIDASLIRYIALRTSGAAGPSGLDALCWRRLCTSFKSASNDLCQSLADVTKRLCINLVDPSLITPFLACRLIALSKNPGVRPIGIVDTARRIITKATLAVTKMDIQDAVGSMQLCAGQISGTEAAVHAVQSLFQQDETEAILMVGASNAFNSLNRFSALNNIRCLCPSLATILINSYRAPTELFIDGDVILSREGTTQGDPLAMPFYAIATIPIIKKLHSTFNDVSQVWYADDASAAGKVDALRQWWDLLSSLGPKFGYFPNASKTWLITKSEHLASIASATFAGSGVQVTPAGRPYLGAAIGTSEFVHSYVESKVAM